MRMDADFSAFFFGEIDNPRIFRFNKMLNVGPLLRITMSWLEKRSSLSLALATLVIEASSKSLKIEILAATSL